ncbi:MAG: tRNA (adenosine(37)-N6)-dimethylallyltransferase MiaA [Bacteroidales bacterium]|nr:tRNA (adenosine(37)-N6)-dimethylallyltransferase MiaA [Bacteroidales bacterium]
MATKTLIVIVGPTGVGKTDTCIHIAEHLHTEIINADSRQMFADLPIGTAAPTPEEQARVKHHFVGNLKINDYYNASMYENDVIALLEQLFRQHDSVVLSGGSMMYVDAVCNGIDDIPNVKEHIRKHVMARYEIEGLLPICRDLERLDPEYYKIVDRKNPKRVMHAVEICLSTGKTYTSFRTNSKKQRPFNILKIGLNRDRAELYKRIDRRVDKMIDSGLLQEAERMYPNKGLNALNTVGYKELFDYFDGASSLPDAVFKIKCNTHKYCRKQLTWFKRDENTRWFSPEHLEEIITYIDQNVEQ